MDDLPFPELEAACAAIKVDFTLLPDSRKNAASQTKVYDAKGIEADYDAQIVDICKELVFLDFLGICLSLTNTSGDLLRLFHEFECDSNSMYRPVCTGMSFSENDRHRFSDLLLWRIDAIMSHTTPGNLL